MIQLRHFALILITLACRELSGQVPAHGLLQCMLSVGGVVLGFGLLTKFAAISVLTQGDLSRCQGIGGTGTQALVCRFTARRRLVEAAWLLCIPATLLATHWVAWVKSIANWSGASWGLSSPLELLGCFVPTFAFMLLTELTAAQFDAYVEQPTNTAAAGWKAHLWHRIRLGDLTGLALCLVPAVMISCLSDVYALLSGTVHPAVALFLFSGITIALVGLWLPAMFGAWVGTVGIEGTSAGDRITQLVQSAGVTGLQVKLVRSQNRWAGAAVVGWFPGFRQLWIGDALVDALTPDELDMVALHEIAHVTERHFLQRLVPILYASISCVAATWLTSQFGWTAAAQVVGIAVAAVVLVVGIGERARHCEFAADRVACELARRLKSTEAPATCAIIPPARHLSSALEKLLADSPAAETSWLHPSLHARQRQLLRYRSL